MHRAFAFVLGIVLLSGIASAGCASDSYSKACASCSFDADGKMDKECYNGYQASGTACVSASFPIAAAKYAQGQCPQIDQCAAELSQCKAQYATGNDKADCEEGTVSVCFSAADSCVNKAVVACGENPCPATSAGLVLLLVGVGFVSLRNG